MMNRREGLDQAFTLLELVFCIAIVAVLTAFVIPAFETARRRAEGIRCQANLRSLHSGFELYLQEHDRVWPHPPSVTSMDLEAVWWREVIAPYGPTDETWRCPSRIRDSGLAGPGLLPNSIDYLPELFDRLPGTAYKWSNQPWLIEVGNFHGSGNLVLFSDGRIETANGVVASGS